MEDFTIYENWLDIKRAFTEICNASAGYKNPDFDPFCLDPNNVIPDPVNSTHSIIKNSTGKIVSGAVISRWATDPFTMGAYTYTGTIGAQTGFGFGFSAHP